MTIAKVSSGLAGILALLGILGYGGAYVHDAISQEIDDFRQQQAVIDAKQDMRTDPIDVAYHEDKLLFRERQLDDVVFSLMSNPNDEDLLKRKGRIQRAIARHEKSLKELEGKE